MNHEDKAFWDMVHTEWTQEEQDDLLFQSTTDQLVTEIVEELK